MRYKVICEHPKVILNRALLTFVPHGGILYTNNDGEVVNTWHLSSLLPDYDTQSKELLHKLNRFWYQYKLKCESNRDSLDTCYYINPTTGETCPVFVEVPCNHCSVCLNRKRSAMAFRCEAESQMHPTPPLFITLTYDNEHLPNDQLLHYDHVQKFLKRLRMRLSREYHIDKHCIRYVCKGEYGGKNGRPHYHLLVWGMPYVQLAGRPALFQLISKTWSVYDAKTKTYNKIGRTQTVFSFNTQGAGYYLGKYLGKNDEHERTFMHGSTRDGGIGSSFIDSHKDFLLANEEVTKLNYVDKFTGKLHEMPLVKYFVNRVFPTISMRIPQELRYGVKSFVIGLHALETLSPNDPIIDRYLGFYQALSLDMPSSFFIKPYSVGLMDYRSAVSLCECSLSRLYTYIMRRDKSFDFSDAVFLSEHRNNFFTRLATQLPDVDVSTLAYNIKSRSFIEKSKYINC